MNSAMQCSNIFFNKNREVERGGGCVGNEKGRGDDTLFSLCKSLIVTKTDDIVIAIGDL